MCDFRIKGSLQYFIVAQVLSRNVYLSADVSRVCYKLLIKDILDFITRNIIRLN